MRSNLPVSGRSLTPKGRYNRFTRDPRRARNADRSLVRDQKPRRLFRHHLLLAAEAVLYLVPPIRRPCRDDRRTHSSHRTGIIDSLIFIYQGIKEETEGFTALTWFKGKPGASVRKVWAG